MLWALEGVYREGLWTQAFDGADWEEYANYGRTFPEPPYFGRPLPPPLPPRLRLRVRQMSTASPFDLLAQIPGEFYAAGGAYAFAGFLQKVEDLWNMPLRIRLEKTELERDLWRASVERDEARDTYYKEAIRRSSFELESGSAEIPSDWDWPER